MNDNKNFGPIITLRVTVVEKGHLMFDGKGLNISGRLIAQDK